jgi:putative salt-induced outer membrane protein YdiY
MRSIVLLLCLVAATGWAQEPAPPPPAWSGNFAAGLALTRGNSDTSNVNLTFDAKHLLSPRNTMKYDAFYLRAETDGERTVDRTLFGGRDEFTISPLTYAIFDIHFLRDRFKEIDLLITPTAGIGHHFVKTEAMDFALEAGAGAVIEENTGLPRETSGALSGKQIFVWKFSPTAEFNETLTGLWKTDDFGDALYHFEASLLSSLTTRTQLKLSFLDDYKSKPPRPEVEKNDMSFLASIVMKF